MVRHTGTHVCFEELVDTCAAVVRLKRMDTGSAEGFPSLLTMSYDVDAVKELCDERDCDR